MGFSAPPPKTITSRKTSLVFTTILMGGITITNTTGLHPLWPIGVWLVGGVVLLAYRPVEKARKRHALDLRDPKERPIG